MAKSQDVINFRRRLKIALVKSFGNKCQVCGISYPQSVYDFHHLNPAEKEFGVGAQATTHSKADTAREAKKCIMVCANCHRLIEHEDLGKEGKADVERIRAIRQACPDAIIRVDANQGWTASQAISIIKAMEDAALDIELVEQPVPAHDFEGMKAITRAVETPILADESVFCAEDAIKIIQHGAADLLNIKLMKTGGIWKALQICSVADIYGVKCMMGCMLESRLSVAAGSHLAAAKGCITICDLDGPSLCSVDPYTGGPVFDGAKIRMTGDPGIGVDNIPCTQWL